MSGELDTRGGLPQFKAVAGHFLCLCLFAASNVFGTDLVNLTCFVLVAVFRKKGSYNQKKHCGGCADDFDFFTIFVRWFKLIACEPTA